MLREFVSRLLTPFPAPARRLGYLNEQIAIRARERRHRERWAPHLSVAQATMREAAARCPGDALVVVLGAGVCLDIPVRELTQRFRRVALLDVGFLDRAPIHGVVRIPFDVTGCLERWHDRPRMNDDMACAVDVDPGWPEHLGSPDLTISANLLGQLHFMPSAWLTRQRPRGPEFSDRLAQLLAQTHLRWLRALPGSHCLIADLAELAVDRHGAVVDDQPLPAATLGLQPPDRTWDWDIAPIPEWDREHHLRHRVGAWHNP